MIACNKYLIIISLVFINLPAIVLADVEDIIDAKKELDRVESDQRKTEREILRGTRDGVQLGYEEFQTTCAVCHGREGKGDGMFSAQLKNKPKDLTVIKKNHGGVFPFKKMYEIIDGREGEGVHGSRTMPIWGGRYSAESWFDVSVQHAETVARGKIFELLLYLESIQVK